MLFCTDLEKDGGSTLQTILSHLTNYKFNLQFCREMPIYINTPSWAVILYFSPHSKRLRELQATKLVNSKTKLFKYILIEQSSNDHESESQT